MKKIISLLLCICMILSISFCVSATGFNDLDANHWAYNSIMNLVNEGTINGYEDGTFKPSKSVTRAEFVKMIGKWNQKFDGKYDDLNTNHWAYEYIMWSGLEASGTNIYPDMEIKRSDVINLIWKRNGSPKHNLAPNVISSQGTNADATSWAYTIGLMKGDDGLNLRLDSSLTRAEAATLIIRSREMVAKNSKNNFIDVISEDILSATYNSLNLLGDTYNANKKLTYGEIARMSLLFAADGKNLNFVGSDTIDNNNKLIKPLDHKYYNDVFVLAKKVWGEDYYTLAKIDENVTKQDAISAIMYGYMRRGTLPLNFGQTNLYYLDCKDANSTQLENMFLSYANINGIRLKATGNLGAQETLTVKEYSAIMVQLNELIGLSVGYLNGEKENAKINTNLAVMPANYKDFKSTIKGVPTALYNLKNDNVNARNDYQSINLLSSTYNGYLSEVAGLAKKNTGYTMDYTFYPSLSYKQNGRVVFAAKFVVTEKTGVTVEISVDELLSSVLKKTTTGYTVQPKEEFYVVFETYGPIMDVYMPYTEAYAKAVFVN